MNCISTNKLGWLNGWLVVWGVGRSAIYIFLIPPRTLLYIGFTNSSLWFNISEQNYNYNTSPLKWNEMKLWFIQTLKLQWSTFIMRWTSWNSQISLGSLMLSSRQFEFWNSITCLAYWKFRWVSELFAQAWYRDQAYAWNASNAEMQRMLRHFW